MPDSTGDPSALTTIISELVKYSSLGAVLFFLLREQMNRFDRFLAVIETLRDAVLKHTLAVELLTNQCRVTQSASAREKELSELRRTLAERDEGPKRGQDGSS